MAQKNPVEASCLSRRDGKHCRGNLKQLLDVLKSEPYKVHVPSEACVMEIFAGWGRFKDIYANMWPKGSFKFVDASATQIKVGEKSWPSSSFV
jgi:hypothetical protein